MNLTQKTPYWILLLALLLSACSPATPSPTALQQPSATPRPAATATPTAAPTPLPALWIAPYLPEAFMAQLNLPAGLVEADSADQAQFTLQAGPQNPLSSWVYALAAPFYTLTDGVTADQLRSLWAANRAPTDLPVTRLLVDESTLGMFTDLWGQPGTLVQVLPANQLLDSAWKQKTAWAILPFEQLEGRWKVLAVDGLSPLRREFDPAAYALAVPISLQGGQLPGAAADWLPATNRDPAKLTVVALTGVTALVRGTASLMETQGMTYPASDEVAHILRTADIAHVSNEIPFAARCPNPHYNTNPDLVFCSRPDYIQLLEYIGTDVVELTGDHFFDWGPEAMLFTLQMYKDRGWGYYGGGANIDEASAPLKMEVNGTKIAFLGCNGKPAGYATASKTGPGAYHCNMADMVAQVKQLRTEGYLPIFTFQHLEYYEFIARPALQRDFQAVADAGAVIVSGSQAHQPHAIELRNGAFIHYGLGNLFFDQVEYGQETAADQAFIDLHIFYDGRYLGTELVTLQFVDLARSRLMLPQERAELLGKVFAVSQ